ncbi:protein NRT1/ PTR FAMILY 1.2-like [Ipomoea triloba]|uniref:protein NRT1/ PTR FAMILY 1.2-like n=1 Tax=Ipomoea triloba TaxID=35885 RepID=UPI00125E97CE|nr:protein NRT1/ PTR FAMILY 1.2-like [Ipomoea triloba]
MIKGSENGGSAIAMPLLQISHSSKGGFTTLPFIIGNSAFMNMASSAVAADMIVYLMREYHMDMASGSNLIYFWSALTNVAPVIEACMADSSVGRFRMIGFGSVLCFLGTTLLWVLTVIPQARPSPCSESTDNICRSEATTLQLFLLCTSLVLMSVGWGGMKTSLAFGADQLKNLQTKAVGVMEGYFSWYYAVSALSIIVAMTGLVYIQENMGWELGFGVLVVFSFLAALSFFLGSPFYVKPKPKKSLITGFIQVIVASYRNRHLHISSSGQKDSSVSYHSQGTKPILPTQTLRFLNKACIVEDPQRDLTWDGRAVDPWRLCRVDQVEELKALIRVIPIWMTGAIMSINANQSSFAVLQATSMDRHIGPNLEIPAGSVTIFAFVSVIIWIVAYDRLIIPAASGIVGKPVHFSTRSRMGFGLVLSFLSMVAMAAVEGMRRGAAVKEGSAAMSILWVAPQYALLGLGTGINGIAQNEFYISEFPESMSGIASNLSDLGAAVGTLLASMVMSIINELSGRGGQQSWIASNINEGHYDYFNWVVAGLSMLNFVVFLVFRKAFGPCRDEVIDAAVVVEEGD